MLFACKDDEKPILEVTACLVYNPTEIVAGEVEFSNCSENATDYYWDFGDGFSSEEYEPIHTYNGEFPFQVTLIASNEQYSDTIIGWVSDEILVKKPNVYFYPLETMDLCVDLYFPKGGKVVESIPYYNDGWCVEITPNGKIDNKYDYLFYESKQPNLFQTEYGWCVQNENLKTFFENTMNKYNFSSSEIKDFIEYWIPRLKDSKYYLIFPQTKDIIEKTVIINFSTEPDNLSRLFFSIKGFDEAKEIKNPYIEPFKRNGFHVVEWGVITL